MLTFSDYCKNSERVNISDFMMQLKSWKNTCEYSTYTHNKKSEMKLMKLKTKKII